MSSAAILFGALKVNREIYRVIFKLVFCFKILYFVYFDDSFNDADPDCLNLKGSLTQDLMSAFIFFITDKIT